LLLISKCTANHSFLVSIDVEHNLVPLAQGIGVCPQGDRQVDFAVKTLDVIVPVVVEGEVQSLFSILVLQFVFYEVIAVRLVFYLDQQDHIQIVPSAPKTT